MIQINIFILSILLVLGIIIYEDYKQKVKMEKLIKDNFLNIQNGQGSVNMYNPTLYYIFKKPFNLDDYF